MENVTLVIRIDAGLINVNPETVEEALNRHFWPDGAVSVFYAAQQPLALDLAYNPEIKCVEHYDNGGGCSCGMHNQPSQ